MNDATLYRCQSFKEVEDWLLAHWDRLQEEYVAPWSARERSRVTSIRFHGMEYREEQSNTHSAPRGKQSNWSRKADKPYSYPGWYGRILIDYEGGHTVSDTLKAVNVCTGSGGGGSYEVTLWEEDFPNLHGAIFQRYPSLSVATPEEGYRIASFDHDVRSIDRISTLQRAYRWYDLEKKITHLNQSQIQNEFSEIDDKIDRLARAFGDTSWRYYVGASLHYSKAEIFENQKRCGNKIPILPIGDRMWQMREFLLEESDMAVEWKLRGDLSPSTPIIDLKARAERLLLEGKIASLSPDT